ncbi:amino acid aminotransferase [Amphiplicatus metriothermophilus]|uniref:Aspartate aminotransferase n=1 Tax=Amphiplicatus metriothermophilus TaxID=1519374 RepID=A0A239PQZ5_9PROT|nr:amino acid aminotransferase [Amphiplicatus metriothermophilus]MBB5518497.1 aspartate/tyrosine/aromatic aminotransferase [Amphiplicatus metriothermophilus]SNT72342.1 aspartate aminotransferase [Amphiplicatus metriothermophilus]
MFADVKPLPPDPILGLSKLFVDDPRERKIDLGVGVFRAADNTTPVLKAVKIAEQRLLERQATKAYAPPAGVPGFVEGAARLVFGEDSPVLRDGRSAGVQTPGGCGALRVGAEILRRLEAGTVYVGAPTWPNHAPLLTEAGLKLEMIPYYDAQARAIEFDGFIAAVEKLGPGDVLLVHGACHNPTGADLDRAQIDAIIETADRRGFLPFVDLAYHGFAAGLDDDAYIVREMARRLPELLVSYSCSKNFGLYRERTGALLIVGETGERAGAIQSHALNVARGMYSMPPAHGGSIVAEILQSPELEAKWRDELAHMRDTVKANRRLLARTAAEMQLGDALAYIEGQNGMFSLLPLSEKQVLAMREKHGVYMTGNARINLCGVNAGNVAHLCEAYRDVTQG